VTVSNWPDQVHLLMQLAPVTPDGIALLEDVAQHLKQAFAGTST